MTAGLLTVSIQSHEGGWVPALCRDEGGSGSELP
jgi:hypothetical protein